MTTIQSVYYIPAGESLDAGVGEALWDNNRAIKRFAEIWSEEASKLLDGAEVTVATRGHFTNASKLRIKTDTGDDNDVRELVGDMLDRSFETASELVTAEFAA